jgi:hypothetical protein
MPCGRRHELCQRGRRLTRSRHEEQPRSSRACASIRRYLRGWGPIGDSQPRRADQVDLGAQPTTGSTGPIEFMTRKRSAAFRRLTSQARLPRLGNPSPRTEETRTLTGPATTTASRQGLRRSPPNTRTRAPTVTSASGPKTSGPKICSKRSSASRRTVLAGFTQPPATLHLPGSACLWINCRRP